MTLIITCIEHLTMSELPEPKAIQDYDPSRVERIIAERVVPMLDRDVWREEEELDENHVRHTSLLLARSYLENTNSFILAFARISIVLLIVDYLFYFPSQSYGLAFDIWGAWVLLVYGTLRGRYAIAKQSKSYVGYNSAQRKDLARSTVFTNIGLIWLTLGFLLQIFSLIHVNGEELVPYNLAPYIISLF